MGHNSSSQTATLSFAQAKTLYQLVLPLLCKCTRVPGRTEAAQSAPPNYFLRNYEWPCANRFLISPDAVEARYHRLGTQPTKKWGKKSRIHYFPHSAESKRIYLLARRIGAKSFLSEKRVLFKSFGVAIDFENWLMLMFSCFQRCFGYVLSVF